ncbi:type I asparaginase [Aliikangiella coralliicola]|uniref:asparaginase n=1 Tax=Aliikangiella coralliicola TaxID=2592383 RepID=A0A545U4J5_9GAMM|nr:type I asparaginase [Aliikangiella coralliicola]TQV84388.1 type I asparaginase [Aliikangiella coralliicola]
MKRKVLILYTGGTIGMQQSCVGYVVAKGLKSLIDSHLDKMKDHSLPEYDLIEMNSLIDSANLQPEHWYKIATILVNNWYDYDGFVVLHGTDTMAYTASALSYMLQGLDKSVILTGSQIPMIEPRSDAINNLFNAIDIAGNHCVPEVCIYFSGRLLRGNRSTKLTSIGLEAFDSPNFPWLGEYSVPFKLNDKLFLKRGSNHFIVPEFSNQQVVMLQLYPGFSAQLIEAAIETTNVKGIVLQSFGMGNISDKNSILIDILKKAIDKGIVVFNVSQCRYGRVKQDVYGSGSVLNRIGVVSGHDMTVESALTKLHFLLACHLSPKYVCQQLTQPLSGEMTVEVPVYEQVNYF